VCSIRHPELDIQVRVPVCHATAERSRVEDADHLGIVLDRRLEHIEDKGVTRSHGHNHSKMAAMVSIPR